MFDRWTCFYDHTFVYDIFKEYHTEINQIYWSFIPCSDTIKAQTKGQHKGTILSNIMVCEPTNMHRYSKTIEMWKIQYSNFENWVRLSAALSANSYLEIYLKNISWVSLSSCPGILINSPKCIDGLKLIKNRNPKDFSYVIERFTKGTWQARKKAFKEIFNIDILDDNNDLRLLESLRKLRNGVGHGFGRDLDVIKEYSPKMKKEKMQNLTQIKLQEYLSCIDRLTIDIDSKLKNKYIGSFEELLEYHKWDKVYDIGSGTIHSEFKNIIYNHKGLSASKEYYKEMIKYYDRL